MRMPSAKLPVTSGPETRGDSTIKDKETTGLIGRMRRTLKRGGSKSPKDEPPGGVGSGLQRKSYTAVDGVALVSQQRDESYPVNGVAISHQRDGSFNQQRHGNYPIFGGGVHQRRDEAMELNRGLYLDRSPCFDRSSCPGFDNGQRNIQQNGDSSHVSYPYNRCDVMNGSGMNGMEHYNGRVIQDSNGVQNGSEYANIGGSSYNGMVSLHETNGQSPVLRRQYQQGGRSPCYNGGAEFERQGARPKIGLYRKKSDAIGKSSSEGSLNTVVLNLKANPSEDGAKGKNVIADVHLRVGNLVEDEEENDSAYHVPSQQQRASFRKDISLKVFPKVGIDSKSSDVTVNCSFNVHCHITGMGDERESSTEEVAKPDREEADEAIVKQQNNVMSSAELEPLVIQMMHQPENETPRHPRTPHIAEVMMRDSLANIESEKSSTSSTSSSESNSLTRDPKKSRGNQESRSISSDERVQEKLKKEQFEEVVLLPKDSQIIDVVTTPKDAVCTEEDMKYGYNLPRSVSEGAAILASYRNDDVVLETSVFGPAIDRRTKPKSTFGDYAQPENLSGSHDDEDESPPPIPPRISMAMEGETKKEDWETEPTHMCLPALMSGIYHNTTEDSASSRSKSLPRHSSLNDVSLDSNVPRRSKTAHLRNRVSQLFKTPRRKSCAFPDRPLPDVPANRVREQPQEGRQSQLQRPQSLYCPTDARSPVIPPPPARPCPQRPTPLGSVRSPTPRPGPENMVVIERSEGFPVNSEFTRCREFATSLRRISECGWYWGPMSWDDAEMRLENTPDGSFLVRDSSDDRHILSLTFRVQGSTHHTRIEHHNGKFSFWSQPTTHGSSSIVEFIEEAMRHSRNGRFLYFLRPRWPGLPPVPLQLLYPISRYQKARSLQHMCRFVIRRHVRLDHIDALPLPRRLKEYLREGQYYTPDDIKL